MPNTTIGSINLMEAVETHEQAAQEATNYITDITNDGIWVTPEDAKPSNGQAVSTTTGWHISDVLEYFKAGASWIKLWVASGVAKLRLGLESSGHVVLDSNGMEVLTDASTSVASFGSTVRIGKAYDAQASDNESHMELDYHSLQLIDKEGGRYLHISDLRKADGSLQEDFIATGASNSFILMGEPKTGTSIEVKVNGVPTSNYTINGDTLTLSAWPTASNVITVTYTPTPSLMPDGSYKAFTFGARDFTYPIGSGSFASGMHVCASGKYSTAIGIDAHAYGKGSVALSNAYAYGDYQTAIGKFNDNDPNNAFEIGNGISDNARSNAAAITWLGEYIAQGWAGIVQMFAGAVTQTVSSGVATVTGAPAGWLLCDGSAVSRTEYATLFAAIGTTWGAGDSSTTFNLPDLRGRAAIGAGTGTSLTARTLGGTGGSEALANHDHNVASNGYNVPGKSGGWNWRTTNSGSNTNYNNTPMGGSSAAVASITKTGTAGSGSSGNMMPFSVVNFIIHTGKTS